MYLFHNTVMLARRNVQEDINKYKKQQGSMERELHLVRGKGDKYGRKGTDKGFGYKHLLVFINIINL